MVNRKRLASLVALSGLAFSVTGVVLTPTARAQSVAASKAADSANEKVPIRKITLYRSGVGYFERAGKVEGDADIQLRFNTDQINDILKSMVLLDKDGGRIDAVSYGSKEPLARRLASFGVDISGNPSIPDLLNQLRGASIRVSAGEQVQGTILGIEQRVVPAGKDQPARTEPYLNLVTPNGLRSLAISGISSFEILDKELAGELNKALEALAEYRADRTKTVDIHFSGEGVAAAGARDVVVGYIHEMPVWKTSYRLILPDESAKKAPDAKAASLAIQGWAIVENNTDQDWNDVRLALVSGRPVSFQMDLYEPLYVFRPTVPVPVIPGVAPRAYQGGMDASLGLAMEQAGRETEHLAYKPTASRRAPGAPQPTAAPEPAAPASGAAKDKSNMFGGVSADDMASYAARSQAAAGEVGEVFQYELEAPVTIERQRSAMIPILAASISGRRVSIFNLADGSEHPMRGVEITNDTNLQLLPGPLAVFDGSEGKSAYAGDAQIGHIGQGDKRLLAFAVDLDVSALTESTSNSNITKLRIVEGMFEQTVKTESKTSYAFKNADEKRARTIIVEQTKYPGWTLTKPEKAAEVTQSLYRFEVPVAPGKADSLVVAQERIESQRVGLTNYDMATLVQFHTNGKLSDKVMDTMRDLGRRQGEIAQAERDVQELDRQIGEINQDQSRIRENMARIDKTSQLYTRYMTKLSDQETRLEELNDTRKKAQAKLEGLRKDLNDYIRSLNVE
jgi:hypothetical protein